MSLTPSSVTSGAHMNIFNNKQHNLTKPIQFKFGDGKIGKKESPEGG